MAKINIYALRAFFDGFSYAYYLLDSIAINLEKSFATFDNEIKCLISKDLLTNQSEFQKATQEYMKSKPNDSMIIIMMLGMAELISVCEKTEKAYNNKIIRSKLDKLKNNFDYQFVRDALAHWEEYVKDEGREQKKGNIPTTKNDKAYPFPYIADGRMLIFYRKELDIVKFRNDVREILKLTDEIISREYSG